MNYDNTLFESLIFGVLADVEYNIGRRARKGEKTRRFPAKPSTLVGDSKERAMPQRSLIKNRPWIYVAADEMSEYDLQAARQLISMDPRTNLNNDLAFGDITNPNTTVVTPTKRKRPDHATTQDSLGKRAKRQEAQPAAKRLGIPGKVRPTRHLTNTKPAVKGDIYEFTNDSFEKPHPSQAANTKMQRSKKAAPRTAAVDATTVDQSSPVPIPSRAAKRSKRATVEVEVEGSASPNRRVDSSTKSGRKVGRPKKRKSIIDVTEKPGRNGGRPKMQTTTVEKEPRPSLVARSDRAKHREAASHATSKVHKASKGTKQKPPQVMIDDDDIDRESDADEEDSRQGNVNDHREGDESEAEDEEIADNTRSSQDGFEEVLEKSEDLEVPEPSIESSSQVGNQDGIAEENRDLLGQHREWDKVLKTAKSVHRTELKTERIKDLIHEIKEARYLYKSLEASGGTDHDALVVLNEELQDSLDSIGTHINDISEHNALSQRSKTITDIYGRAIPAMVFLLERALSLRSSQPRGLHDFHALEEIVRIQDMTLRLCEKAKSWKVRPNTAHPIMKPTISVLLPYIRGIRNKFYYPKLHLLRVREKVRANALKTAREKEARFEQSQRGAEALSQRGSQRDPRILNNIQEEAQRRRIERNRGRRVVPVPLVARDERRDDITTSSHPSPRNDNAGPHQWTEEETQELVVHLYQSRDLPGEWSSHTLNVVTNSQSV